MKILPTYSLITTALATALMAQDSSAFSPSLRWAPSRVVTRHKRTTPLSISPFSRGVVTTKLYVSLDPRNMPPETNLPEDGPPTKPSPLVKLASSPVGAIAVIAFVILFHELGHYLAAKSLGVAIDEFSVGWGPKLLQFQAFGDAFSLRALPLGGYVSVNMAAMMVLPWWLQLRVVSAGVLFNFLLAFIVYTWQILFGQGFSVPVFGAGIMVTGLDKEAAAQGLLYPGDVIEGVNGKSLLSEPTSSDMKVHRAISKLIDEVQNTPSGVPVILTVLNAKTGKVRNVEVEPKRKQPQDKPSVGAFLFPNFIGIDNRKTDNPLDASALAASMVANLSAETAIGLMTFARDFLSGRAKSSEYQISGPVSVIKRASEVVKTQDLDTVLKYMAAASINLGVINLFPVPPSDGFQILFTTIHGLLQNVQP